MLIVKINGVHSQAVTVGGNGIDILSKPYDLGNSGHFSGKEKTQCIPSGFQNIIV